MIYFIRHGESEANLLGVFAGQRDDSPLTEKGKQQARIAAEDIKLKTPKVDLIISSPLIRAFNTAQIIAKEIGYDLSQIRIDNRISEYDMGSFSGTPFRNITSLDFISAPGAEDASSFHARVFECLKEFQGVSKNVLFVSHGGVGRMLQTIKEDTDPKLFFDIPGYPNALVVAIDWI